MTRPQLSCDVAVVGGGPAGTLLAGLLARRGISAVVVERGNYCEKLSGHALSPALHSLFSTLGSRHASLLRALPCCGIDSIWGSDRLHRNEFFWTPYGNSWHVERPGLDRVFAEIARANGAELMCLTRVLAFRPSRRKWTLKTRMQDSIQELTASFLVDATGRTGAFFTRGPRSAAYDRLIGISWMGTTEKCYPYTAVESVSGGWFYAHPVPGSRFTVVLMTDSDILRSYRGHARQFWREQLEGTKHIRWICAEISQSYPQRIFSALTTLRAPSALGNFLTVGDAAMSSDPISGQGVYDAWCGALRAASAIDQYFRGGSLPRSYDRWIRRSFGDYMALRHRYYGTERRWSNHLFWRRRHLVTG